MSIEDRINQNDCLHLSLRYDGRQPDSEGRHVELYTCSHPLNGVPQCKGTFTGRELVSKRLYVGKDDKEKPYYWRVS